MLTTNVPEIQRTNLASTVLSLKVRCRSAADLLGFVSPHTEPDYLL